MKTRHRTCKRKACYFISPVVALSLARTFFLPGVGGTSIFFVPTAPDARCSAFAPARLFAAAGSLEPEGYAWDACATRNRAGISSSLFIVFSISDNGLAEGHCLRQRGTWRMQAR